MSRDNTTIPVMPFATPPRPPCGHFRYTSATPGIGELGLGVAALDLIALGYAVLPLEPGVKRPHCTLLPPSGGVHHASRDPEQIRAWWSLDKAANIGVPTGRLAVVDLDVKNGDDGPGNFAAFLAGHGLVLPPGMPWDGTPSGGCHGLLRTPPGVRVPERPGILPGVDVKGDGGYVVAPPSMQLMHLADSESSRSEEILVPYEWRAGCPCSVPWAPPWFGQWATTAPSAGNPKGSGSGGDIDAEKIMARGAPAGLRNDTLYKLACSRYRRHGTSGRGAALVLDELRRARLAGDTGGFSWSEVLRLARSAREFIEAQEQAERQLYRRFARYLNRAGAR